MNAHMLVLQLPLVAIKQLINIAAQRHFRHDNTKKCSASGGLHLLTPLGAQPHTLIIVSRSPYAPNLYFWPVPLSVFSVRQLLPPRPSFWIRQLSASLLPSSPISSTTPRGAGVPLSSSFALFYFFSFSFSHSLYLFSSIVHPFPFYQKRPTMFPCRRS